MGKNTYKIHKKFRQNKTVTGTPYVGQYVLWNYLFYVNICQLPVKYRILYFHHYPQLLFF